MPEEQQYKIKNLRVELRERRVYVEKEVLHKYSYTVDEAINEHLNMIKEAQAIDNRHTEEAIAKDKKYSEEVRKYAAAIEEALKPELQRRVVKGQLEMAKKRRGKKK